MEAVWCSLSPTDAAPFSLAASLLKNGTNTLFLCAIFPPLLVAHKSKSSRNCRRVRFMERKNHRLRKIIFQNDFSQGLFFSFFERPFLFELKHFLAIIFPIELVLIA